VEGPRRSTAVVTDTVITTSNAGVIVQTGKADVQIDRCQLLKSTMVGLAIGRDSVGEVCVNDSVITDNYDDVRNDGGPKSSVVRDGVVLPQERENEDPALSAAIRSIVQEMEREDLKRGSPCAKPMANAKAAKMAGIGSVNCAACGKEEPPSAKYNLCSRCLECAYCSKECQV